MRIERRAIQPLPGARQGRSQRAMVECIAITGFQSPGKITKRLFGLCPTLQRYLQGRCD
jgi:hypothetical protein